MTDGRTQQRFTLTRRDGQMQRLLRLDSIGTKVFSTRSKGQVGRLTDSTVSRSRTGRTRTRSAYSASVCGPSKLAIFPVNRYGSPRPNWNTCAGMVFSRGYRDEQQPASLAGDQRAFEYLEGVTQVVIPNNTSTASNQIAKGDRARAVNQAYQEFLEYYQTAAVSTHECSPQDKGNVEVGVKVVTHDIIGYLADLRVAALDEFNAAIGDRVDVINACTPFRGSKEFSRKDLFDAHERDALLELPQQAWQPVVWRKSKVNLDYHIEVATVKYLVPYRHAGRHVDVRIIGDR